MRCHSIPVPCESVAIWARTNSIWGQWKGCLKCHQCHYEYVVPALSHKSINILSHCAALQCIAPLTSGFCLLGLRKESTSNSVLRDCLCLIFPPTSNLTLALALLPGASKHLFRASTHFLMALFGCPIGQLNYWSSRIIFFNSLHVNLI